MDENGIVSEKIWINEDYINIDEENETDWLNIDEEYLMQNTLSAIKEYYEWISYSYKICYCRVSVKKNEFDEYLNLLKIVTGRKELKG